MITALAWSPTRPVLAVAGYSGLVQLWRLDGTPRPVRSLTGLHAVPGAPEAIQALTFSPDGQLLAAGDSSRTGTQGIAGADLGNYDEHFAALAIWQVSNGKLVVPKGLGVGPGRSGALTFSRDGKLLAASRPDGSVLILNPTAGQVRQTVRPLGADEGANETVSLAFAPNGTLVTGTHDRGGSWSLWRSHPPRSWNGPGLRPRFMITEAFTRWVGCITNPVLRSV